jgi:hypothetical protein
VGQEPKTPVRKRQSITQGSPASKHAVPIDSRPKDRTAIFEKILSIEAIGLLSTIIIGLLQWQVMLNQAEIAQKQNQLTEKIGNAQNRATDIQIFVSLAQSSGIETSEQRRATNVALQLYSNLVKNDPSLGNLRAALPKIDSLSYEQAIMNAKTEEELKDIKNTFSNLVDTSSEIIPDSYYLVSLGAFRDMKNAINLYKQCFSMAENSRDKFVRPRIFVNEDNLYVVTLGYYKSKTQAIDASLSNTNYIMKNSAVFAKPNWKIICDGTSNQCLNVLNRLNKNRI